VASLLLAIRLLLGTMPFASVTQEVELVYRLDFGDDFKGDRREAASKALEIVRKRVETEGTVRFDGEKIVVRTPRAHELKPRVVRPGVLRLLAVADGRTQAAFNENGTVPDGYEVLRIPEALQGEHAMYGERVLARKEPIVQAVHVKQVDPRQELTTKGTVWAVGFELTPDGARRFDAAAEVLCEQRPRGLIAIVLDGEVHSVPLVLSASFQGKVGMPAKSEADARALAGVLGSGALPVPLELVEERPVRR